MRSRNDIGTFLNEHKLLGEGVEVGVWRAQFSEIILRSWQGKKLHLVDTWGAAPDYKQMKITTTEQWFAIEQEARERMQQFDDRVAFYRAQSVDAANLFADDSLDFIYIDGNHGLDAVLLDLRAWFPKLRTGGLFAGHDFWDASKDLQRVGVRSAVHEFTREIDVNVSVIPDLGTYLDSWFFLKGRSI